MGPFIEDPFEFIERCLSDKKPGRNDAEARREASRHQVAS